jgi:integrase
VVRLKTQGSKKGNYPFSFREAAAMTRSQTRVPKSHHHKASGQARVRIEGHDHYLGPWGSPEAEAEYRKIVGEYLVSGQTPHRTDTPAPLLSVNELLLAFLRHAQTHYVKNGRVTAEYDCFKSALRPLRELYGMINADDFGPVALKVVRQQMIAAQWTRRYVNKSICRIRHVFRWGVENELVSPLTLQALQAVQGLQAGRCAAPDNPPRHPVAQPDIDAVKAKVSEIVSDLIDLQLLTGARSGELVVLTTGMLERTGDVWTARIGDHKTAHHGKDRVLCFGPKAQLILRKYLNPDPGRPLFNITTDGYRRAITRACTDLEIPIWTPHWLRHTFASRLREGFGLEAAQVMLGHSQADVTQIYAQKNLAAAIQVAKAVG